MKSSQNRGFAQNKQEICNTKLKTVYLEEKRRHNKSMPSRLKKHNKEKKLMSSIRRSLSNKLIKILSNYKFDNFNDCDLFGR